MKSPAVDIESPTDSRKWSALLGAFGLLWLVGFSIYFHRQRLPNNPQFSRPDLWLILPELLAIHLPGGVAGEGGADARQIAVLEQAANSGWQNLPQRFDVMLFGGMILVGTFGWGSAIVRGLRIDVRSGAEFWALSGGLGLGAWSLFTLGSGLLGLLWRPLFVGMLPIGVIAGIAMWWRDRILQSVEEGSPVEVERVWKRRFFAESMLPLGVIVAVAPFLLAMALGAMLPSTDFDVKEYHLGGPKEFFQSRRITFLPHNVYTSFPFLTEMLSLSAMVVRGDWYRGALAGKFVLMAFAPLSALAVFAVARRLVNSTAGWWAVLIHLSTPWIYRISIIAYTEGGLAFYLIASLLAAVMLRDARCEYGFRSRLGHAALVGLLAGCAAACKYPGLVLVSIPITLSAIWFCCKRMQSIESREPVRHSACVALGVLVAFGPWLAKNFAETGNPVYPLCYSIFGGEDWNPELDAKWKAAHAAVVLKLGGWFHWPGDLWKELVDVAAINDWGSPLLWGFAPLTLVALSRLKLVWGVWLFVAWVFLAWWGLTHRIDRFWVPMIPAVAVLAGIGADATASALRSTLKSIHMPRWIGSALVGLPVTALVLFNLGFVTSPFCGYNAYLLDEETVIQQTTTPSIAAIHEARLPELSRVLMVGEAEIFDARFDLRYNTVFDYSLLEEWFTADEPPDGSRLRTDEQFREHLVQQGITHIFVNWSEILRYRQTYGYTDFVTARRFEDLVAAGVLRPTAVRDDVILWSELSPGQKDEVLDWSPELQVADGVGFRRWALYEVVTIQE